MSFDKIFDLTAGWSVYLQQIIDDLLPINSDIIRADGVTSVVTVITLRTTQLALFIISNQTYI